jgi:hypothetical protein
MASPMAARSSPRLRAHAPAFALPPAPAGPSLLSPRPLAIRYDHTEIIKAIIVSKCS